MGPPSDATEEERPVSGQQQCGSGDVSKAASTPAEGVGSARATATTGTTHLWGRPLPAMPSPAQSPLPPPPAPPAPPQVPPPPPAPRRVSSAPKTPPKTPPKAKSGEPTSPKASPGAKAAPTVDLVTPKSPEAKAASLGGELPHRPFRVGPGGALEAETIGPSSGYSMSMISRTPVAKAPASEAPPEPSETSGRPPQRRMEACIACHGSGELPMRANRRLFRLLTSSTASAATANAAARGGATASVLSAISGSSSSEADVTHFKSERGVGLFVELACSKASVLSAACAESRACYVGVHGNLEKIATQNHVADLVNQVMEELKMTRSASDRELGEVHLFCHVHMSLPCTGGSPLQNFSGGKRVPEHERKFFELLAACDKLLDRLVERHPELSMSFELPNSNRYWTHPKLQAFVQARIPFRSVVHACAMGIEGLPGLPIKKAFRIMSSSEELSQRLEKRFHCACDFHASFNFSDFQLSEKYSRKFARFFVRMLALLALR